MASGVYDTGTITLTNGSATVTGSGTSWVGNISAGNVLITNDGAVYPIEEVVSATEITLSRAFTGSGGSGASYEIVSTGSVPQALAARVNTLISNFQSVKDEAGAGKFGDGSSSQPGIRFTADEDTGIRRTGSNEGALVAGGIDVFPFEAKGGGSMIQSSATDTTAGRLMAVGAFGLGKEGGVPAPNDDADDCVVPGFNYRFSTSGSNTPQANPYGSTLHVFAGTGGDRLQQLFVHTNGQEMYIRSSADGGTTWSDWSEIYSATSILGTVSQSGGTPTGALIERGSNANGEYVRFADGTQICTHDASADATGEKTWNFPAAFAARPQVSISVGNPNPRISGFNLLGVSSVTFSAWDISGNRIAPTCYLIAVGRWF